MDIASSVPESDTQRLQKILGGISQGVVLIEPDGTIAWANDAALGMHGSSSLKGLGLTVQGYCKAFTLKYRNNHVLQADQYPIMRAWNGEEFAHVVVDVNRGDDGDNRVLETHSVRLDTGRDGHVRVALIISDVTERFDAEQRFEKAFNANPAPALICRLSDFRYVRVNRGFLEMTGYAQDQVLGRSAYELDVLTDAEHREEAIANIGLSKTIPQMQALLPLPDGKAKHVIVAGQPIEVNEEACMLFTFIDLDPRKRTEDALRQTEERFSKAFRLAPVPMMLSVLDQGRLLEANDAFLATTSYTNTELADGVLTVPRLWAEPGAYRQFNAALKESGSVRNHGFQLCTRQDVLLNCLVSAETVDINGQDCVLSVIQDISEYKQSEGELIAAIEKVMQDASWFSRSVIEKLAQIRRPSGARPKQAELSQLTAREREVLGLLCEGMSDMQIATSLKLSRNTVRNHIATLYSKIDVHTRSAAVIWGRERGVVGSVKKS